MSDEAWVASGRACLGRLRHLAGALLLGAAVQGVAPLAQAVESGAAMPEFSVALLDGTELASTALRGRPALVLFWATSCPYCKRLMPGIQRTADRYGPSGLQVLAISFRDDGDVRAWRDEAGLSFDVGVHGEVAAAAWGARGTPTWFFVDGAGTVRYRSSSSDPNDPMLDLIAAELLGLDPDDCGTAIC